MGNPFSVFSNDVWKKAVKKGVGSICALLVINLADPQTVVWSWFWWRHLILGCITLLIITEAQYWKNWAEASNGTLQRSIQTQADIDKMNVEKTHHEG